MALPLIVPSSIGVGAGVFAESLSHDTGRAATIAVGVAAAVAVARWTWKAILRQMRAEITAVNQVSLDKVAEGNSAAVSQLSIDIGHKIDELARRNDVQHSENGRRLSLLETRVHGVEQGQDVSAAQVAAGASAVQALIGHLATLQSDVASLRTSIGSQPPAGGQPA